MFEELSGKLSATLQGLMGRGVLTEDAIKEGLREIRRILLEADVSFDLTREFLERVQQRAVGAAVIKDVRPGHQLVKIVHDELVALLGERQAPLAHATVPPTIVLVVGLQGSGKTTTAACTEGSTMRVETILGTFVYKCQNGMWICIALETSASFSIAKSG